jgi:chromosome segregation ATPase
MIAMKTTTRKTKSKESRVSAVPSMTDLINQLEQRIYQCVERIHQLEQQNTEYQLFYQKHKHGVDQTRHHLSKELVQKDQMMIRLQAVLKSKDAQILDLQETIAQQDKAVVSITNEYEQLKQELKRVRQDLNEPAEMPGNAKTIERVRERIHAVLNKLDQLERMMQSASLTDTMSPLNA